MSELPEGWVVEEESVEELPSGWTVEKEAIEGSTPEERDKQRYKQHAGPYYADRKSLEEIKKMSVREKMQYAEDLRVEREYMKSKSFLPGVLSGLTFGASEDL